MNAPKRLAILISGRGSNVPSIQQVLKQQHLNATLAAIYSNRADAPGLRLAKTDAIPTRVVEHRDYADRDAFDQALHRHLVSDDIDAVILAGFMRILGPALVREWQGRMLNIHPSLLPLYPGLDTHARALAAGDSHAGASVHYVTPQLDGGPVIIQSKVAIEAGDDPDSLSRRVLQTENIIYPLAVEWMLQGRLEYRDNNCYLDQELREQPVLWQQDQLHFEYAVPT
ncbi:MAG: phosphoribosylglycinamide formyltransferase [Gammaproteobacteria bacterium]|nr:phosphoribosylglycinamide formyltransferase [Gammaproteobacteria bacterium]